MKRLLIVAGAVLALSLGIVGIASADNGPHGGYTATTDACAGCHRAHTGQGAYLLKAGSAENSSFCFQCHDGTGAYTDVKDGVLSSVDPTTLWNSNTSPITANVPLKGGGFVNALMNTSISTTIPTTPISTTSAHPADGGANNVWGFGSFSSGATITDVTGGLIGVAMTCVNCHNPHGNAGQDASGNKMPTYRILRGTTPYNPLKAYLGAPNALISNGTVTATSQVNITDTVGPKDYSILNSANEVYFNSGLGGPDGYGGQMIVDSSAFCASCHQRYLAPSGSATTDSTDAVFKYRHAIKSSPTAHAPGCLTCHVSHGTSATMSTYSGNVKYPDGTAGDGNGRSSLLRLDNRGVCEQCHQK